jgi:hypothetical protein
MKDNKNTWDRLMTQSRSRRIANAVVFGALGVLWLVERLTTHSAVLRWLAILLAPLFFLFAYIYVRSLLRERER